jgi:hypothetical protein
MTDFISEFENEKAQIMTDSRLSGKGKEEKIQQLRDTYISKAKTAKKQLKRTAVMGALRLREAQAQQAEHLEKQRSNFDFARLNYEAQAVRAKLANMNNLSDVYQAWNEIKASGDPYKIKSFKDTAGEPMGQIGEGSGVSDMRNRIFQDMAETSIDQPDPDIAEREREELGILQQVEADAQALDEFLAVGKYVRRAVIERAVFDGIKFDKQGKVKTEFEVQQHPLLERDETFSEVADRLEREAGRNAERAVELGKKFGIELDPDLDDLRT